MASTNQLIAELDQKRAKLEDELREVEKQVSLHRLHLCCTLARFSAHFWLENDTNPWQSACLRCLCRCLLSRGIKTPVF